MSGSKGFKLQIEIRHADSGEPVSFKVDGERFEGGNRTLKFAVDTRYNISFVTMPTAEFHTCNLAGSDISIHSEELKSGKYNAHWDTSGINVCKKGIRENIILTLQGRSGILKKQIQCKFYAKEDSHVDFGHKLKILEWTCANEEGNIKVTEENYK